jgi:hypothetical protein
MSITFDELAIAMIKCPQTAEQSVYQHGISVKEHVQDLIHSDFSVPNWKLPDWLSLYKDNILSNLHDEDTIAKYSIFHDCGKPFCRIVDENGKHHFPDHANISKKMFLEAGGCQTSANLIGWDMDFHTCTSDQINDKCRNEWTIKDAFTLLLTAFAEICSNSKLFGGSDSISYKIKFKQLDKRGKQICKFYFGEKP